MNSQNAKQYYPNVNQSIGLVVKMLLLSILIGIPFYFGKLIAERYAEVNDDFINSIFTFIAYIVPIAIICFYGLKKIRQTDSPNYKLSLNTTDLKTSLILVIMMLAIIVVLDPIDILFPVPDFFLEYMEKALKPSFFSFLTVVIVAPILEEVLFRGIILNGFLKNYTPWKAILWSALLFGVSHLNPWQAIPAIGIGMLIGWIYWRTGSILPGILIHFTNNLIGFLMMVYAGTGDETFYQYLDNKMLYFVLFASSIGVLYLGYKIISKKPLVAIKPIA